VTGVWGKGVGRCARCSAMAAGRGVGEPLPPIQRAGKGVEGETVTQRDAKGPEGTAPLPRGRGRRKGDPWALPGARICAPGKGRGHECQERVLWLGIGASRCMLHRPTCCRFWHGGAAVDDCATDDCCGRGVHQEDGC
jgi:hypothetical protein